MRALLLLLAIAPLGCSLALDFDDVEDLPCPCDENHVCLIAANRCVRRASVDLFKSCSQDTANNGDDLCASNAVCQQINDQGPRCLPTCQPTNYATPEAALDVAAQCPVGSTCWATERGGVCSEGVCSTTPNNCPAPGQCVIFNSAGVCFTPCDPFTSGVSPCGGNQVCHPIGAGSVTACVPAGVGERLQLCSADEFCKKDDNGRALVCDRPFESNAPRRCLPICELGGAINCVAGETCVLARPNVTTSPRRDLGICEGGS